MGEPGIMLSLGVTWGRSDLMDSDWMEVLGPRAEYLHFYAVSEASRKAAQDFEPRPSDVTVATYTKCGTTMMQQFIEMLRSEGKLDFDEITAVQYAIPHRLIR